MNTTKDVLLGSTLHDPRGVFLDSITHASNVVLKNYKGWVINVTTTTDQRVKDVLRALAPLGVFMTETDPNNSISIFDLMSEQVAIMARSTGLLSLGIFV